MIDKKDAKEINKNLMDYIKRQIDKGYSIKSIKKVMTQSGYHDEFIEHLIEKHHTLQSIKKRTMIVTALLFVSIFCFAMFLVPNTGPTGFVVKEMKYVYNNINLNSGNKPPQWDSIRDMFIINKSGVLDLNLYFNDPEKDQLNFNIEPVKNVKTTISNGKIIFVPEPGFYGNIPTAVSAFDGTNLVTKNITLVIVG